MCLVTCIPQSDWLPFHNRKMLNCYAQSFLQNSFISVIYVGCIDLFYLMPFLVALCEGHKVSRQHG